MNLAFWWFFEVWLVTHHSFYRHALIKANMKR
jgi:hypothetical protein